MPTLQDLVRDQALEPTVPVPTVPAPQAPVVGEALLPEANMEAPPSATMAIEQLARERYGGAFVDQYGDILGFRPSTFNDRLRNVFEILASKDPGAARRLAFQGAQARADLEDAMVEQARQKRRALSDLYAFVPNALKSGMSSKNVLQLFSEQYAAITGKEAHPAVMESLMELEKQGEQPIGKIIEGLDDGSMSVADVENMTSNVQAAVKAITDMRRVKTREEAVRIRGERVADQAAVTGIRKDNVQQQKFRSLLQSRDRLVNMMVNEGADFEEAFARVSKQLGLPYRVIAPEESEVPGELGAPGARGLGAAGAEDIIVP